jgi:hypothetical protein
MSADSSTLRPALHFLLGGLGVLLALELLLRLFPVEERNEWRVSSDTRVPVVIRAQGGWHSGAWDFTNAVYSGVNRQGFPSPHDYREGATATGIFGDSFPEGLSVRPELRIGPILQRGLGQPVYQFASSGARAVDSLQYVRHAAATYRLKSAVVVFGEDVSVTDYPQNRFWYLDSSSGEPVFTGLAAGEIDALFSRSALFRYVYFHLKVRSQALDFLPRVRGTALGGILAPDAIDAADGLPDQRMLQWLVRRYAAVRAGGTHVCFVLNADLTSMYERGERPRLRANARAFKALALADGFPVVDMSEVLLEAHARSRARFDSTPYDRHWNALGHAVAARHIAEECLGNH